MKKWVIIFTVLLVIILAGAGAFYIYSQPSKEALSQEFKEDAVTKLLGRKAQLESDNAPTGSTVYKGKHITFEYPAKALEYNFRENSTSSESSNLEDFSFDLKDPRIVFNMTVVQKGLMVSSASDLPAVRLREQRSEYTKSTPIVDTVTGVVFQKGGMESEKSGFFIKGDRVYTISVSGTNEEAVGKQFDTIVKTVSFSSSE